MSAYSSLLIRSLSTTDLSQTEKKEKEMLRKAGGHLRLNLKVKPAVQYMTLFGIEAAQGFVKLCSSLLTSEFVTKQV